MFAFPFHDFLEKEKYPETVEVGKLSGSSSGVDANPGTIDEVCIVFSVFACPFVSISCILLFINFIG